MKIGTVHVSACRVTQEKTAQAMGSGDLPVFATPAMVALMEKAAAACVREELEPGQTTVGTRMEVSHTAATPEGMQVTAHAQLVGEEGRVLRFKVWAEDEKGPIGEGTHDRVIVGAQRFLEKTNAKLS